MPGESTTTTNTQARPMRAARPLIKSAMRDARQTYNKGIGSKFYNKSTVVPFAGQTKDGMQDISSNARANMGQNGLGGQMQDIINRGGFNQGQSEALNKFRDTANADYSMDANPGFKNVLSQAQNDARNQVGLSASAMGRYGSGIAQGNVAREVGNLTDRMVSDDYNRFLGRQDAATQNMFNANQQGQANMQGAYSAMQDPAKALMGVGAMNEDLRKRQIDDRMRRFDARQNAPWNQIGRLMSTANMTSQYAPSQQTTVAPGPNPLLQGIGGVATGYGLLGSMGLF